MGFGTFQRAVCHVLCLQLAVASPVFAQSTNQRQAFGALTATGDVSVNGARVTGESTMFVGDELRTGAGGAASIAASGRGVLVVSENSQLRLVSNTRYVGIVERGGVRLRALPGARSFQLKVGEFAVVPVSDSEAVADIARNANGAAEVYCRSGSVALIALEGENALFLFSGQSMGISAEGQLAPITPAAEQQPPAAQQPTAPTKQPPSAPTGAKKSKTGAVVGAVAAAAGAGAALALRGRGGRTSISP